MLQAQATDVKAATELVQAHATEMTELLQANASAQHRIQQMELDNDSLHTKLSRAEDALVNMRTKFKYDAPCRKAVFWTMAAFPSLCWCSSNRAPDLVSA